MNTGRCIVARLRRASTFSLAALLFAAHVAATACAAEASPARAAIASAHPLATAAGQQVLAQGGNAFDAAVAVAATLAVVEPYSSGLGGGGFWLLHRAEDRREVMVDGRETAPGRARAELYVDSDGNPKKGATRQGGLAVAIPGAPAALVHVAERYGRLPLAMSLAPAIRHARDGFAVDPRYARIAQLRERFLQGGAGTGIFLDDGRAPRPGHLLRQPGLAATLDAIAREGAVGFYRGRVADTLVAAVNAAGGVWRADDLERYRVLEREPMRFMYRGAHITAAALPSAGGIALAQSLGMLERLPTAAAGAPQTAHFVIEALRRAFRDRAAYLGDGDFSPAPLALLLDRDYLRRGAAGIDPAAATPSSALGADGATRAESGNTTHLSVIDASGNRVAATLSINFLFGAGIVAGDTGVLLNNEMDDFTVSAAVPNAYRLRGAAANAIAPGKRPLSSMTPVFVEDGRGVLILGAPGGSRIVSQVLLAIVEHMHAEEVDLQRLVGMPRYHHQFLPDRVEVEPDAFAPAWREALAAKGHVLQTASRRWGNMQVVFRSSETGLARAANDPRGSDVAWY